MARARDVRLETGQAIVAGVFLGWLDRDQGAINEAVGTNPYYVLLMAAAVLAAWVGGLPGGISAVVTAAVLNQVIFVSVESEPDTAQFLQALYIVTAVATVLLIASRRVARPSGGRARRGVDPGRRGSGPRRTTATDAVRVGHRVLGVGRRQRQADVVRRDLPPAWAGARTVGSRIRRVSRHDPSRRPRRVRNAIGSTLEPGGPATFELDFRIVWPDGSVHWTHGAGRLFRDDDGRPVRMIGTGQDITERRRILEDRDRLLDEERRAGAFREAFVDVISHELRTPITTIMGLAQILARPGRSDDETSRMALLEDVRSEAERLHRLVEDLLVLSRVERGRLEVEAEPIEPRRLLERIVSHEARELPSITVETDLEPDLPIVAGESTYVEQIVRNLLNNASKYTPYGTRVVVSARRSPGHHRGPGHR